MRIVLADDDLLIRKGLQVHIEQMGGNYEVVAQARDGIEALELVRKLQPDLLISDVKMPLMDGVELIQKLRAEGYEQQILMLSGYGDYEYLREAMRCSVADYLLKPINFEEFDAILHKCAMQSAQQRAIRDEKSKRSDGKRNESNLARCITSRGSDPVLHGFDGCRVYAVAVFSFDQDTEEYLLNIEETGLRNSVAKEMVQDFFHQEIAWKVAVCVYKKDLVCLLGTDLPEDGFKDMLRGCCGELRELLEQHTRLPVSCALSEAFRQLDDTAETVRNCRRMLRARFYAQQGQIYENVQVPADAEIPVEKLNQCIHQLTVKMFFEGLPIIQKRLNELFDIIEQAGLTGYQTRHVMIEFLNTVYAASKEFRELSENNLENTDVLKCCLFENKRFSLLRAAFIKTFLAQIVLYQTVSRDSNSQFVEAAKRYVRNHYAEQISLKEVAENLHLNYTYLSGLFKEKADMNFTDYLTKVRMDEAKKMLRSPEVKIYEIADRIGYLNSASFTRAFKKYTGLTPEEYRNILK